METTEQTTTTEQVIDQPQNTAPDIWNVGKQVEAPIQETAPETTEQVKPVEESASSIVEETPKSEVINPTEKIVEKIVEKLPEFKSEREKRIYESLLSGETKDVYEYLQQINKDYATMSDVDVVKESLKLANPTWTEKDIQMEIKYKFGTLNDAIDLDAIDKDEYPTEWEQARRYNEALEEKELLLSREARDARILLDSKKSQLELPKLPNTEPAPIANQPTQEEIDELNRKWEANVAVEMAKLSDFKFKVGDEEVTYKITDEDKAKQTAYMKDYNGQKMALDLGWIDADGNENVLKIAQDMLFLQNKDRIISSAATQMKTTATKEVVADIKNIDLTPQSQTTAAVGQSLADAIWKS